MSFFVSNYSFNNFDLEKIAFFYDKVRIAQVPTKIYQKRKSPDSPGSFKYGRAKSENPRIIWEDKKTNPNWLKSQFFVRVK